MAALLVAMSIMAVMLTVAMPVWKQMTQREREEELVFRGMQYAHAIGMFQRKYANAYPPNLDVLLNEHLGFRGYMMMMRLQRAENLRDLHDLLPDFAKALVKRIGIEKATPIVSELERLIVG